MMYLPADAAKGRAHGDGPEFGEDPLGSLWRAMKWLAAKTWE